MWRARIGWLIANEVRRIKHANKVDVEYLVTITRSTPHFLEEAKKFLTMDQNPSRLIVEDNIEGLTSRIAEINECLTRAKREKEKTCLLFTDVISTGNLVCQTVQLLEQSGFRVLSIFSVADVRTPRDIPDAEIHLKPRTLVREEIPKLKLSECAHNIKLTDIDELEVCPVGQVPQTLWGISQNKNMWLINPKQLLNIASKKGALLTGHYHIGEYHHYVHYIVGEWLLDCTWPDASQTIRTRLEAIVADDLGKHTPDKVVVLCPDSRVSRCADLVELVCHVSGATWRHTIYRDQKGPRWSFSAFVEHGVPMEDKSVVIVDDGSCSGDTLIALTETAALGGAKNILVYFLIDRMPLTKSDMLARIRIIQGRKEGCKVKFRALGGVQIPAYTLALHKNLWIMHWLELPPVDSASVV